ncbi:DUF4190 domain-containing protein [Mycobacterium sp. CBMA271]|uniref:DUF4190 domain-containing protein n=1 Tax=unclassified Mycobacteroides TaxID=2618759 RepID=UPI0012DC49D0|nr:MULTISPECIES: DUF4190 domain-containing protein [unclassified Mycobacteroides]MUM18933.1 DUF4190 domain-containing protein [Mycobacteroides sp. CBMA 326]MUM22889.1 DUF4190 domain-containing protein [Mycobacteroides sp. CBMA 271]
MTETPPPPYPAPYPPPPGYLPYPYPYGAPVPVPTPKNGLGLSALIVGIIAIILSCTIFGGFVGGVVAIILGALGLGRVKRAEADNRGVAIAGIVLGGLAIVLSGVIVAFTLIFMGSSGFGELYTCASHANGDKAKMDQCQKDFEKRMNPGPGEPTR